MDNYIQALANALDNEQVTVSVKDLSVNYYDLERSRNKQEIIEAVEATDSPIMEFFVDGDTRGQMSVLVGYGDESICDHHVNEFMDTITKGTY